MSLPGISDEYFSKRLEARVASELIGVARGLIFDGYVTDREAVQLHDWLHAHPEALAHFPGRELARLLMRIFADGFIDDDEREALRAQLEMVVGGGDGRSPTEDWHTTLPLDRPPPSIAFGGSTFVFTGSFAFGERTACIAAVESLGGTAAKNVSRKVDYLVIGEIGSLAWVTSSYGRKIERAADIRARGDRLRIVEERHWLSEALRAGFTFAPFEEFEPQ